MAQLIKLKDYISRYELDIYRYPSQYIRLKRDRWQKLYQTWLTDHESEPVIIEEETTDTLLSKLNIFRRKHTEDHKEDEIMIEEPKVQLPDSESELKRYFLNELFPFQLKWATSSLSHVSHMDQKFNYDKDLEYFLKRFPDNYFVMYYPVFNIKKAPVDAEIILINPVEIEVIYLFNDYPDGTVIISDDRTWTIEKDGEEKKVLSPIHALKRTEQLVNSILKKNDIYFRTKKTVLAKENLVIFQQKPFNTQIIGKREYEDWFQAKRKLDSPLKSDQLKATDQLLKFCLTSSVKRPEWDNSQDTINTVGEE